MGTQIGIYNVLYECNDKTKCGHKLYHVQCIECGHEFDMMKSDIGRAQECKHRGLLSKEEIDKWYANNKKQCLHCGQDISLDCLSFNEYNERKFCNKSCSASYYNAINKIKEKQKYFCINCGKELKRKGKYCSTKCQQDFHYKEYIEKWKNGYENGINGKYGISLYIKRYLREKYNNKCAECGWHKINQYTKNIPLEVHHLDGDYTNNNEENLILLCPNCHSLTATYKAANKGSGRKDRKKYTQ